MVAFRERLCYGLWMCRSLLPILWFSVFTVTVAQAGKLYWNDRNTGKIQRSNLDGSEVETLREIDSNNLRGIAIDVPDGMLYFADNSADTISKMPIDGGAPEIIVSGLGFPADITLDFTNRKLYWCDQNRDVIERANLDGTQRETVIETKAPYYLELDIPNNKLYWGDFFDGNINRTDLSTIQAENLFTGQVRIRGVKLDRAEDELFWCNRQSNHIQRRKVAGGPVKTVITDLDTPHGLVIDPVARKAYWCDTGTDGHNNGGRAISRTDLDVAQPLETVAELSQPWDADIDLRTTSFEQYKARYFRVERTQEETELEGDFDQDGYVQLLEYGLASHAARKDLLPSIRVELDDSQAMLHFERFKGATDLEYQVEVSSDLENWETHSLGALTPALKPLGHGVEAVSVGIPGEKEHVRIRVSKAP